jgi:hypothetical protein
VTHPFTFHVVDKIAAAYPPIAQVGQNEIHAESHHRKDRNRHKQAIHGGRTAQQCRQQIDGDASAEHRQQCQGAPILRRTINLRSDHFRIKFGHRVLSPPGRTMRNASMTAKMAAVV